MFGGLINSNEERKNERRQADGRTDNEPSMACDSDQIETGERSINKIHSIRSLTHKLIHLHYMGVE